MGTVVGHPVLPVGEFEDGVLLSCEPRAGVAVAVGQHIPHRGGKAARGVACEVLPLVYHGADVVHYPLPVLSSSSATAPPGQGEATARHKGVLEHRSRASALNLYCYIVLNLWCVLESNQLSS